MRTSYTRPPIERLACVESDCDLYGLPGQGNLTVRKIYGKDKIRYLRCKCCRSEFSERKGTALWNTKGPRGHPEVKAVSVAAHLSEGCSLESIVRLVDVDISVVQRLNGVVGKHGRLFHQDRVIDIKVAALEADERYGFSDTKQQAAWEAEVMDPRNKLLLAHEQGRRDEALIRRLYEDAARRVINRHDLVLFTDGEPSYATLFPEYFGVAYQPSRSGVNGRRPNLRYRIPRTLAHVHEQQWPKKFDEFPLYLC
jgi:IS1 family transposase/transposase-like protein